MYFYKDSLKDYEKLTHLKKLSKTSNFNITFAKLIKQIDQKNFIKAIEIANEGIKLCPDNRCIKMLKKVAEVQYFITIKDKPEASKILQVIKRELNLIVDDNCQDHEHQFLKGIINLFTRDIMVALNDFEKAIQNNDDSSENYHFLRGMCYACLSLFKEASNDFGICLKLNEKKEEAYINRGKCSYLLGDISKAFKDFQSLLNLNPV